MITLIVLAGFTVVAIIATLVTTFRDGYRSMPEQVWTDRVTSVDSPRHVARLA
jgi:hypothetical protein